jgi:polysaccharide export outer membrane protein
MQNRQRQSASKQGLLGLALTRLNWAQLKWARLKWTQFKWTRLAWVRLGLVLLTLGWVAGPGRAQTATGTARATRQQEARQQEASQGGTVQAEAAAASAGRSPADDPYFAPLYRQFYETYQLGPGDEVAIRVAHQPEYTLERAKVSPGGRLYHPLLGDIEVAGMTVPQLHRRFNTEFAEYLLDPQVSVELIEANSAKIGVLGEVRQPGIIVLTRPLTVLDAIASAGGFADTGNQSNVTLLRQVNGRLSETKVDIKRILAGKAPLSENPTLRAGDTLLVRGNYKKKLAEISAFTNLAFFVSFIAR